MLQDVALAGPGRADEADVVRGGDPFQAGEVVQCRGRDAGGGPVELVEGFGHRERGGLEPGAGVGGVPGADLGLDQGAQQLFGRPALGLGGDQQLGRELAHRGELEPAQPVDQVRREYRRLRAHDDAPVAVLPMA
jgi:hypothetical protein